MNIIVLVFIVLGVILYYDVISKFWNQYTLLVKYKYMSLNRGS